MREGTVPVPPDLPCAYGIVMYYLFRSYRISGGSRSGWGETPVSVYHVIEHFSRAEILLISTLRELVYRGRY